jgi:formylglycine-generating enzyme required for sulfatase activity
VSTRITKPDNATLQNAREHFRALLERRTKEAEWQRFFAENPFVFSMSLPLRLDPSDIISLGRPGRSEPDFVFYPQSVRPAPFFGVIELKRPDTKIFTVTRKNLAVLTSDAQTAIRQAQTFAKNPGALVPIEHPQSTLFLGNNAYLFVIMGMSSDLTLKFGTEIYNETMRQALPGNLRILRYDELLASFEKVVPPRVLFLVPAQDRSVFEFDTVILDAKGNVQRRLREQGYQMTEELARGVTLDMVEIPGGGFRMGAPKQEIHSHDNERPQREMMIRGFYLGKFPVTRVQWRSIEGLPRVKRELKVSPSDLSGDQLPVVGVSWEDAIEFCERLSRFTGKPYRLPSEAEWEYACRAGTQSPFAFGSTITREFVNYGGRRLQRGDRSRIEARSMGSETSSVGSLVVANRFGLYDMHGNVCEWCHDKWHKGYEGAPCDGRPWLATSDEVRVLRGGSFRDSLAECRSAFRHNHGQTCVHSYIGFRVALAASTLLYEF